MERQELEELHDIQRIVQRTGVADQSTDNLKVLVFGTGRGFSKIEPR